MQHALVYGGSGALGKAIVSKFASFHWAVTCVDFKANADATTNVVLTREVVAEGMEQTSSFIEQTIASMPKFDAIINVAGGWAGGNAASEGYAFIANLDFYEKVALMHNQSVNSSVISAKLASRFLNEGGLLTLTGAAPCVDGTPGMIAYGMAKAAVHHLTKSLATPAGGLPGKSSVLAYVLIIFNIGSILPITLDTPMNRKWMADADFSTWTTLDYVSEILYEWASLVDKRPVSGSLVKLCTVASKTELVMA